MKKILFLFLVTSFLLPFPALARDGAIPTLRQELKDKRVETKNELEKKKAELKDEIEKKKTEIEQEREENKEARTTKIEERKATGIQVRQTKAQANANRLRQGIVSRYESILKSKANVEARIAKIEAANTATPTPKRVRDMTAAKAKLASFDTSKYVTDLATFDVKVAEVLASTTPLKLTSELKAVAKTLDADLKGMRTTLADTLRLIITAR